MSENTIVLIVIGVVVFFGLSIFLMLKKKPINKPTDITHKCPPGSKWNGTKCAPDGPDFE